MRLYRNTEVAAAWPMLKPGGILDISRGMKMTDLLQRVSKKPLGPLAFHRAINPSTVGHNTFVVLNTFNDQFVKLTRLAKCCAEFGR